MADPQKGFEVAGAMSDVVTALREEARHRAEALDDVGRQKHLLESILTEAPVGISVLIGADPALRARWANPAYLAFLEEPYRSRGITGVPIGAFLPNAEESGMVERVRGVAATRRPHVDREYRHEGFARGTTWWRYSLLPLPSPAPPVDVMVVAMEITDEVAQRARLAAAVKARDEFLSIASHELRTPLTSLWLQLQLLSRDDAGDAPHRARLEVALRQAARLRHLVESLLDVSRIHAGGLALQRERLDLGTLAREVVDRMGETLRAAGCTVEVRAGPGVAGSWDRSRVDQILVNLLQNVARHAPGSRAWVEVEAAGDAARLRVRDEGPGVPEGQLERVFERFERASPPAAPGGLGLGLYIVRQLAHAHGGEVTAARPPGGGAEFVVELPRER